MSEREKTTTQMIPNLEFSHKSIPCADTIGIYYEFWLKHSRLHITQMEKSNEKVSERSKLKKKLKRKKNNTKTMLAYFNDETNE